MQITQSLHQLKIDFSIQLAPGKTIPRFVNVLIIFGKKITLIDTGVKGSEEKIFNYIQQNGRSYNDIETVILSHAHPDHIGSAAKIKELTGCKVLSHPKEQKWIENIDLQEKERPVPGFKTLVDQSVTIDGFLEDEQLLTFDNNLSASIIHSPGHAAGLLSFFFIEDKILFTGDAIPLKNDIPNYDHFRALKQSLRYIKNDIPYKILLTSWTPSLYNKAEATELIVEGENYLNQIDSAVKKAYKSDDNETFKNCRNTVQELGLPPFMVSPIVDKAFRSHLSLDEK